MSVYSPKALHYKELEFFAETSPSTSLVEELIQINTNLQQSDAAFGILTVAKEQYDVSKHEEWYERLHRWKDALAAYEKGLAQIHTILKSSWAPYDAFMLWASGLDLLGVLRTIGRRRPTSNDGKWQGWGLTQRGRQANGIRWTITLQP